MAAAPASTTAPVPTAVDAEPGPASAGLVAVIDDDLDVRQSLAAVLERWGHPVLAAPGAAAWLVQWQRAGRPAVQAIVSDLRLAGGVDGIGAVATLRAALGTATPALLISGDLAPERLQTLRASGLPWLSKPVMPMRLRSWLQVAAATAAG